MADRTHCVEGMNGDELLGELVDLQERIAEGMSPETRAAIDIASDHSYHCTCATCLAWWAHVGPDGGDPGDYGPFTKDQVNAEQHRLGLEVTP